MCNIGNRQLGSWQPIPMPANAFDWQMRAAFSTNAYLIYKRNLFLSISAHSLNAFQLGKRSKPIANRLFVPNFNFSSAFRQGEFYHKEWYFQKWANRVYKLHFVEGWSMVIFLTSSSFSLKSQILHFFRFFFWRLEYIVTLHAVVR